MQTLTHGQQIRKTDDKYSPVITVWTIEGSTRSDIKKNGYAFVMADDGEWYREIDEATAIACNINHAKDNGHDVACCLLSASVISSDYDGKDADMFRKRVAYAEAPVIKDGEHVMLEGREVVVKYTRPNVSDCVHFVDA